MNTLYIIKGLPGSGKTSLGRSIVGSIFCVSADDYFDKFFNGDFIAHNLPEAHIWCSKTIEGFMKIGIGGVAVANTFTQEWESKKYFDLAEKYGYTVYSIVVENHHGNSSVHGVPEATIEKMRKRFEIKL